MERRKGSKELSSSAFNTRDLTTESTHDESALMKRGPTKSKASINPYKTIELSLQQLDSFVQNGGKMLRLPDISSPKATGPGRIGPDLRVVDQMKRLTQNTLGTTMHMQSRTKFTDETFAYEQGQGLRWNLPQGVQKMLFRNRNLSLQLSKSNLLSESTLNRSK